MRTLSSQENLRSKQGFGHVDSIESCVQYIDLHSLDQGLPLGLDLSTGFGGIRQIGSQAYREDLQEVRQEPNLAYRLALCGVKPRGNSLY